MREYKFRGKRIDNGKWTYGDLIQLLGEQGRGRKFIVDNRFGACIDTNGDFLNTEAPFVNEVDPETVGQYTGLKDKTGTDVYEGDILKVPDLYETPENTMTTYHNELVDFDECSFRLGFQPLCEGTEYVSDECKIIGNVHQHSELLEDNHE